MKIFITGATGYVGHALALRLAQNGDCVHVLVRDPSSPHVPKHENIRVFTGDITDRSTIIQPLTECKQVFHTAALVKLWAKDPSIFYKTNVEGTRNVLDEALEQGVKKVVFTSSCGVLGPSINVPMCETDPRNTRIDNDYEFSKLLAENLVKEYCQKKGLSGVIVSLSKVYGPGIETHPFSVNRAIKNFIKGKITFIPKPASFLANYCFINDVVEGHLLAMQKGVGGEKYILGGENISYTELFQRLRSVSGAKAPVIPVPPFVFKCIASLQWLQCKVSGKEPFFTAKGVHHFFCNKALSSDKAICELGYHITPLHTGLQQTTGFLKNIEHA
ncbi:MAG: NAD-dependent epimerase/dehydratase family protein [Chitinophagaceae bacterium]